MLIKTTLNLKRSQADLLHKTALQFELSVSSLLNSLARKIFKSVGETSTFPLQTARFLQTVKYQAAVGDAADFWKKVHISFDPDAYEKCQDLRKMFKLSVSRAFADAIDNYLNELILELEGKKESDNYTRNYIVFYKWCSNFAHITILWDMVDPEILEKIYELQRAT